LRPLKNNFRPYQNNQTNQGQPKQARKNGPAKCTHLQKLGHVMEKCFVKFPSLRPQNQKTYQNQQRQNNSAQNYCRFYEKNTHSEDKCFSLERVERKLKTMKSTFNEVQDNSENSSQSKTNTRLL
jgi:hypothetical protein